MTVCKQAVWPTVPKVAPIKISGAAARVNGSTGRGGGASDGAVGADLRMGAAGGDEAPQPGAGRKRETWYRGGGGGTSVAHLLVAKNEGGGESGVVGGYGGGAGVRRAKGETDLFRSKVVGGGVVGDACLFRLVVLEGETGGYVVHEDPSCRLRFGAAGRVRVML